MGPRLRLGHRVRVGRDEEPTLTMIRDGSPIVVVFPFPLSRVRRFDQGSQILVSCGEHIWEFLTGLGVTSDRFGDYEFMCVCVYCANWDLSDAINVQNFNSPDITPKFRSLGLAVEQKSHL